MPRLICYVMIFMQTDGARNWRPWKSSIPNLREREKRERAWVSEKSHQESESVRVRECESARELCVVSDVIISHPNLLTPSHTLLLPIFYATPSLLEVQPHSCSNLQRPAGSHAEGIPAEISLTEFSDRGTKRPFCQE